MGWGVRAILGLTLECKCWVGKTDKTWRSDGAWQGVRE